MKQPRTDDSKLATGLTGLLADTYVLYNTTQNCHWNVEGPQFKTLHDLFEEQYTELAEAIDTLAERIRAIGYYTAGTMDELVSASRIRQQSGRQDAASMLEGLIAAHQVVIHRTKELQPLAEDRVDEATLDLLIERQRIHEKAVWILKSQAGHDSKHLQAPVLQTSVA